MAKAHHQWQMVTEAALIAITVISTEGFYSSVFFVFFQQEGSIIDKKLVDKIDKNSADEDVVNALPYPLIAIGGLGTM